MSIFSGIITLYTVLKSLPIFEEKREYLQKYI